MIIGEWIKMKLKQFKRFFDGLEPNELNKDVYFIDKTLNHTKFIIRGISSHMDFWNNKPVYEVEIEHIGDIGCDEPKRNTVAIRKDRIWRSGLFGHWVDLWKVYLNDTQFECFYNKADALELKDKLESALNG